MEGKAPIFDKIHQDYLVRINNLDLEALSEKIGTEWTGQSVILPLFGVPYSISGAEVLDPSGNEPDHSIKVVLCQYLLRHPSRHPQNKSWASYKDFRDAAPLANTYHVNTEMEIARQFACRLHALKTAGLALGGKNHESALNYDLHMRFDALPRVPILLLFNDADDEFPAQSLLLYEKRVKHYLDMECLAILGRLLAEKLSRLGSRN